MIIIEKIHLKLMSRKQPFPLEVVETSEDKILLRCDEMLFWAINKSKKIFRKRFWAKAELIGNKIVITPLPFKV